MRSVMVLAPAILAGFVSIPAGARGQSAERRRFRLRWIHKTPAL